MLITVDRFVGNDDATLSRVSVDGVFQCFALEDEYRAEKVAGETRIAAGRYKVALRNEGDMTKRYAAKFDFHQGMLHVLDVPEFKWIYIHIGNTDENTEGCLLVGYGAWATPGDFKTMQSTDAYRDLYLKVWAAAAAGTLEIEYIDNDRAALAA